MELLMELLMDCVIIRNNKQSNSGTEHHNTMSNSKPVLPRLLAGPQPI